MNRMSRILTVGIVAFSTSFASGANRRTAVAAGVRSARFAALFPGNWKTYGDEEGRQWAIGHSGRPAVDAARVDVEALKTTAAELLGFRDDDLRASEVQRTATGFQVVVEQMTHGLEIEDAAAVLNFDSSGHLIHIYDSTISEQPILPNPPQVPAKSVLLDRILPALKSRLDYPNAGSLQYQATSISAPGLIAIEDEAVWVVHLEVHARTRSGTDVPYAILDVIVDPKKETIVAVGDRIHRIVDPEAFVFKPSPVRNCGSPHLGGAPANTYEAVRLARTFTPGSCCLCGEWAALMSLSAPANTFWVDCKGLSVKFESTSGRKEFAAVMAYYWIDQVQEYIASLGIRAARRQINVDVYVATTAYQNNADGEGDLWFGDGYPLAAEDGKVVVHEYAHAIMASQAKTRYDYGIEPIAIREGFADYLAVRFFAEQESTSCLTSVGAWMNKSNGRPLRDIVTRHTYRDLETLNDTYERASIWAGALWNASIRLGNNEDARSFVDATTLKAHEQLSSKPKAPTMRLLATTILGVAKSGDPASISRYCQAFIDKKIIKQADCP